MILEVSLVKAKEILSNQSDLIIDDPNIADPEKYARLMYEARSMLIITDCQRPCDVEYTKQRRKKRKVDIER